MFITLCVAASILHTFTLLPPWRHPRWLLRGARQQGLQADRADRSRSRSIGEDQGFDEGDVPSPQKAAAETITGAAKPGGAG